MAETQLAEQVIAESPEGLREQALRSIKQRRDFHTHVFVYLTMNLVIWGIWAIIGSTTGAWFPWPMFVTLGWGIGVIFNAWDVYVRRPISEADVQREVERLAHRR
jgi:hypothetical protein